MKNNDFDITLSNPNVIMSTIEFKYDNYDIVKNTDDDFMIIASENCPDKYISSRDSGKIVEFNNSNIFLDMIFLAVKLNLKGGFRKYIQNQLTEQHFLIILDFCKKYGLPYFGNIQEDALQYNNYSKVDFPVESIRQIKEKYNYSDFYYSYCNVSYFIYWLYVMYRDFLWYIAIYSEDTVYNFSEYLKIDMSYFIKHRDSVAKHFSPSIANHFSFNSMLKHNNHTFTFAISTNNLFHLSVYYFCLICIGNDSIDISKTMLVKQCKCCGSYFLTSQSRKKYCEYCSPQKAWNKRNR